MLVITAVCLIFAGLKLASLLYDIMFAQIVAPIVVATDMGGAGRLKKVILNLLNCFLSVIIVVLDLRLYILILTKIQDSSLLSNPIAVIFRRTDSFRCRTHSRSYSRQRNFKSGWHSCRRYRRSYLRWY